MLSKLPVKKILITFLLLVLILLGMIFFQIQKIKAYRKELASQAESSKQKVLAVDEKSKEVSDAQEEIVNLTKKNKILNDQVKQFTPLFQKAESNEKKIKELTMENQRLKILSRAASKKALQNEITIERKLETCLTQYNQQQDDLQVMVKRLEHFESME